MDLHDLGQILQLSLCAVMGYLPMVAAASYVAQSKFFHEKITSQEQLEKIIGEEAIKLDMGDAQFQANYGWPVNGFIKRDDVYRIAVKEDDWMATRAVIRNYLFLMSKGMDGEPDTITSSLAYIFVTKPQAILYGAFRIKT